MFREGCAKNFAVVIKAINARTHLDQTDTAGVSRRREFLNKTSSKVFDCDSIHTEQDKV